MLSDITNIKEEKANKKIANTIIKLGEAQVNIINIVEEELAEEVAMINLQLLEFLKMLITYQDLIINNKDSEIYIKLDKLVEDIEDYLNNISKII